MKVILSIGSHMDVCLTNYGHCNYISSRQACIFYDKVSLERVCVCVYVCMCVVCVIRPLRTMS